MADNTGSGLIYIDREYESSPHDKCLNDLGNQGVGGRIILKSIIQN